MKKYFQREWRIGLVYGIEIIFHQIVKGFD